MEIIKKANQNKIEKAKIQDLVFFAFVVIYVFLLDDLLPYPHRSAVPFALVSLFGMIILVRGFAWFFPNVLIEGIAAKIIGSALVILGITKLLFLYSLI